MSLLLASVALAATFPDKVAPAAPAPAPEAMKDCCAKMKTQGKDCCCCKDMAGGHGDHAEHGETAPKAPAPHDHAH